MGGGGNLVNYFKGGALMVLGKLVMFQIYTKENQLSHSVGLDTEVQAK